MGSVYKQAAPDGRVVRQTYVMHHGILHIQPQTQCGVTAMSHHARVQVVIIIEMLMHLMENILLSVRGYWGNCHVLLYVQVFYSQVRLLL